MKKIIILISLLFLLTGCYDYQEVNNLALISAVGIDYKDNEYTVTLEILNNKIDKDSMKITTYTESASSTYLAEAIEKASSKVVGMANYTHAKLLIMSKEITTNHLKDITDLFLRSTYFRENFYVVSSLEDSPQDILNTTTEENPIASTAIIKLLETNDYTTNSAILKTFDTIIEEIIAFGIDTCFSNIKLNDNNFIIDGMVIFQDFDYKTHLDNPEATLYKIINQEFYRPIFSKDYDGKSFSIAVSTGKTDISLKSKNIEITGNLEGKIMNNTPNFNIRDLNTLSMLNKDFTIILNERFKEFIETLQRNNSDILGITKNYYLKTREKNKDLWQNAQITTNITFNINKKGLIYEVENEK